ncbi:hypothetical protein CHH78_04585 [Shouchella clausii]|uniref:Phosphotyrosine protein phosphatase I domain-containing protein n=1 Tax=Shouchella clausii TaxID=79880 RepID=A0A268S3F0_SHOCL|nr:low molecular weight protein arginine phosphatase [Shouchella clausii]PAD44213.1 hypothetical protein CHH54_03120 [Bacillus sp. 7520-S]MBU8595756.1 low molecular weight protein arginine phosphatase [Shouchella clausii]MCY1103656.1 low molecular weight protein arginine phosphatase [Shouchella clausii]MED4159192.1 low molecular weight protein arginine phosphatase [Shouchella clausii]MED4175967.1 low molecular weight protein arginine phosphatase [Shouchella clausii]
MKKRVLFVCTGNTCRSPLAEAFLRKEGKGAYEVRSAGLFAHTGSGLSSGSQYVLEKEGLLYKHEAQQVTAELIDWADIVLVMSQSHKAQLESMYEHVEVQTLKEAAGGTGDISDPFGGSTETYEKTAAEIRAAVLKFIEKNEA